MKECREYEEYMTSLTEQVHDVRAKRLVVAEIKNHIEEQAECYEAEGMSQADAIKAAVRQMGNPIETGLELNKIHKPKMPWMMLGVVIVIMLASIVMQAVIFAEGGNTFSSWANLPKTIAYNCIGLAVILGLLYMDYNFIAKYAFAFYGVFMAGLPVFLVIVQLFAEVGKITSFTAYYGIQMLFPIIFAGIIYRNRNRAWQGMLICLFMGLAGILWSRMVWYVVGSANYGYSAPAESLLIIGIMILLAFWKNIFGNDKKKQWMVMLVIVGILLGGVILLLSQADGMRTYLWMRMVNAFTNEEIGYMNQLIRTSVIEADWMGGQTFMTGEPNSETYGLFVLNSIFTYFGKLPGMIVIAAYAWFLATALRMSLKQSNRIGFLVGSACTVSILVRFVAYVACNLGYGLWWTTLVPFLSYGRVSAVMNGIYIGLILCVYRNSSILPEEPIPQKRVPKVRITVE